MAPRLTHAEDLQALGGSLQGRQALTLEAGPEPPSAPLPGDAGGCLTSKVVWDKWGLELNVTICLVLVLDHQSCVCSYKNVSPQMARKWLARSFPVC